MNHMWQHSVKKKYFFIEVQCVGVSLGEGGGRENDEIESSLSFVQCL